MRVRSEFQRLLSGQTEPVPAGDLILHPHHSTQSTPESTTVYLKSAFVCIWGVSSISALTSLDGRWESSPKERSADRAQTDQIQHVRTWGQNMKRRSDKFCYSFSWNGTFGSITGRQNGKDSLVPALQLHPRQPPDEDHLKLRLKMANTACSLCGDSRLLPIHRKSVSLSALLLCVAAVVKEMYSSFQTSSSSPSALFQLH